jgi:bifunctional dihydroflavonol 4-reductase/flavanone 4-reductase
MKVCVTGAGGYIGSWLVKSLLQRGYTVNATLRNPKDEAKTGPLLSLPGAAERLKLFQADLSEEGAFDSAVEGCEGVFDVASPMDFSKLSEDDYVQPALKGVLNVLKSCSRAKSVRRVVYTSSVGAACPLNEEGELINGSTLDESTWTPVDFMRRKAHPSSFYALSKTLAEKAAIEYGLNSGQMEVVTIGPGLVAGPGIISTFPYSCNEILGPITGNYEAMKLGESFAGSLPFVHIDDLCEAHIFLMEQLNVQGRHICSVRSFNFSELVDFIHKRYPQFTLQFKSNREDDNGVFGSTSSKKLLDMGFSYKYGVEDIFDDTIKWAQSYGILK